MFQDIIKFSESTKWNTKEEYLPWAIVETKFGGYDKAVQAMNDGIIIAVSVEGQEWYKIKTMTLNRGGGIARDRSIGTGGNMDGDLLAKVQDWLGDKNFDIGEPLSVQAPPTKQNMITNPTTEQHKDPMAVAMTKVRQAHTNLNNLKVKALEVTPA